MRKQLSHGLTIVELLIAVAILGVVMSFLGVFFAQQARIALLTQARNEVEVTVRTVAEVLVQDLQMAGSGAVFNRTTGIARLVPPSCVIDNTCVVVDQDGALLSLFYATSLRESDSCRHVMYKFNESGVLQRSDVACADPETDDIDADPETDYIDLADNLELLRIEFTCEPDAGSLRLDPQTCYDGSGGYPSFVTVEVAGRSEDERHDIPASVTLTSTTPNLRPAVDFDQAE